MAPFDEFFEAADRFLNDPIEAIGDSVNDRPWRDEAPRRVERGDIIAITRGVFNHYAVYVTDDEVIHYTSEDSDIGDNTIMATDFSHFLRGQDRFFVVDFGLRQDRHGNELDALWRPDTIYSADETIRRARSKMGEADYDLFGWNCEHFAVWCKTGQQSSDQVRRALSLFCMPGQYRMQPGIANRVKRAPSTLMTEAIRLLNATKGMTRAHRRDFQEATTAFELKDGSSVRLWTNMAFVPHVFLADAEGDCHFGGYVGILDSGALEATLATIRHRLS